MARYADRVLALFREVAAIDDEHPRRRIAERLGDHGLMVGEDGVIVPGPDAEELLQGLSVAALQREGHRLDGLPLQVEQLSREVLRGHAALLATAKKRGELGVVRAELSGEAFDIARRESVVRQAT